ncbi:type I glyceraldehyde-3-phosphate dehydrogenase [Fodinicola acaciae]|uniref:type I glyceraldehyde-3-phosphate dehydrogenase n=1 Tax=Fodinicola acaciae TaxID=2681555 RepID=UPI0013D4AE14|nr:type I glyceraldehyde-3-phosphate dehydrogenase [Fodinicola acaciae]
MTVRIGINGFGRIGRNFLRQTLDSQLKVVAVNDVTGPATLAHLLKYDSTYGTLDRPVDHTPTSLLVDGREIAVTAEHEPSRLDWGDRGVDVVIESTGRFRTYEAASAHLKAGARKVLLSAPGKGVDLTVVMGVNHHAYDPDRHDIVSNASCTTNCVVPMIHVMHESFGVGKGLMTTIHGYTNDQSLLDGPHKDLRRARSAAVNVIPTSTGAARAVGLVIPELDGAVDGIAVRVPVEDGSLTDLTLLLDRPATADDINEAFENAAGGRLAGVLRYATAPIVSRDVIGDSASCVFDSLLTQANGDFVKIFGWYDNEWGYTARLADLAGYVGARL